MPLCGIISSECLGMLPGAWAKRCENVLGVNCCEWLWNTAWASCHWGPAVDWKAPCLPAALPRENSVIPGAASPFLTPTGFFILGSAGGSWVPAPRTTKHRRAGTHRWGTEGKLWWDWNVQWSCADNWCLVVKNQNKTKTGNYFL